MGLSKQTFTLPCMFVLMLLIAGMDCRSDEAPAIRTLTLDATAQNRVKAGAPPVLMRGKSPSGREITVTGRYLTLDGKPWLPVMGEFQFSRYPEKYWEDELLKMKAAGVQSSRRTCFGYTTRN